MTEQVDLWGFRAGCAAKQGSQGVHDRCGDTRGGLEQIGREIGDLLCYGIRKNHRGKPLVRGVLFFIDYTFRNVLPLQ